MSEIKYGWKCPQCGTLWSAWQDKCLTCSAKTPSGVGSAPIGATYTAGFTNGTVWIGGAFCATRLKTEAEQARDAVQQWRDKGVSPKALIIAATDALIEDARDDDDDDDDDDEED